MLCAAVGMISAVIDFAGVKRRHDRLSAFRGMDDELPPPRDIEDADYHEIIRLLRDQQREAQTRAEAEMQAMVDYYTLWAHQIKTPIAAMRLRLQGQDTAEARGLLTDLGRIERYVEMVLTYLRLEGDGTDYVIREHDLDGILRPVFKRFAGEFIARRLKLDYAPVEARIITDEKWLAFVVEQVLSNALKYTPQGTVPRSAANAVRQGHGHRHRPGGSAPRVRAELHRPRRARRQKGQRHRAVPVQARVRQPGPWDLHRIHAGRRHRGAHRFAPAGIARGVIGTTERFPGRPASGRSAPITAFLTIMFVLPLELRPVK